MEYRARKSKYNRFAYRFVGLVFVFVGITSVIAFWWNVQQGKRGYALIMAALIAVCVSYGIFLVKHTFRIQAYDINYHFEENQIRMDTIRGERILSYEDVSSCSMVIPSPDMDYILIQLETKKTQYILSFLDNAKQANSFYEYIHGKVERHEES